MEDIFNKLKTKGHNTSDKLMKWLKDSKVIGSKTEEDNALKYFDSVENKKDVNVSEFKGIVTKIAGEQKKTDDELTKKLTDTAQNMLETLQGAASTASAAVTAGVSAAADAVQGLSKK